MIMIIKLLAENRDSIEVKIDLKLLNSVLKQKDIF